VTSKIRTYGERVSEVLPDQGALQAPVSLSPVELKHHRLQPELLNTAHETIPDGGNGMLLSKLYSSHTS